jgi:unsaturated rhamnogalacturonyl hydrolase
MMQRFALPSAFAAIVTLLSSTGAFGCGSTTNEASCPDGCPPDAESEQVALATAIAVRYIETYPYENELWDWKSGVLMHALAELYLVTGDERLHDYYQSWLDYRIEQGYQMLWSDSCPPAITAVALLKEEPDEAYQQVVDDTLEYLDVTAPRTEEGGISHNGILGNQTSVWLDSLFMFGMVLNRAAELPGYEARLDMMAEQSRIITGILQDDNGFMRHAQDWPGYDESLYWARGNAWVVASLADYLRIRLERDESDPELEDVFLRHVEAIIGAQEANDGMWWSIMNRPGEIYTETSGSALFASGIARAYRHGILGDEERAVAERAVAGIVEDRIRIDDDGPVVTGVSLATDPWSFEEYASVPLGDDVNYGVGAVILALIETSGLRE